MWINQPSTHQEFHKMHGTNVLADLDSRPNIARIYFLESTVISQDILKTALSDGWR
jgi:hypothetical protein